MTQKTPLYEQHLALSARMVDFCGWHMPLHYGSQIEEHHYVRQHAGMFDVSHMAVVDCHGARVQEFLQFVLANDVAKLKTPGRALYTCMLNEQGGILDDLIVYRRSDTDYRLVVNAGTRDKDVDWLTEKAKLFAVTILEHHDKALIAIQGPEARALFASCLSQSLANQVNSLKSFHFIETSDLFIAATGYTGEPGVEVILDAKDAITWWKCLLDKGIKPIGLGARDTLRLEAGLNLYGSDMDESVTPLASNIQWTVSLTSDRTFIGKSALEEQKKAGNIPRLVGLVTEERVILRHGMPVFVHGASGAITSGAFSPTLGISIAMARIPAGIDTEAEVEVRGKRIPVKIISLPFLKKDPL